MKILLLTPLPDKLKPIIEAAGDKIVGGYLDGPDLVVSYNHRKIVNHQTVLHRPHINLHISLLPWNRGADPNFWSWFDHTPKGVSIHYMDAGIDTGPLLKQYETTGDECPHTLRSYYEMLHDVLLQLFAAAWPELRTLPAGIPQTGPSSYHRHAEAIPFLDKLPLGWDTPVAKVERLGEEHHASASFWRKYEEEIANLPKQA